MIKQTAGRDSLGEFAPEFAHLNDDVLFGVKHWHGAALVSKRTAEVKVFPLASAVLCLFGSALRGRC